MNKEITLMGTIDNGHEIFQVEMDFIIDISKPLSDKDIVDIAINFENKYNGYCTYFHVSENEFDEAITKGYIIYDEKNEETTYLNSLYSYVDWSFTSDEIKKAFDNVEQISEN
mgnify:CR=1 FL=1